MERLHLERFSPRFRKAMLGLERETPTILHGDCEGKMLLPGLNPLLIQYFPISIITATTAPVTIATIAITATQINLCDFLSV